MSGAAVAAPQKKITIATCPSPITRRFLNPGKGAPGSKVIPRALYNCTDTVPAINHMHASPRSYIAFRRRGSLNVISSVLSAARGRMASPFPVDVPADHDVRIVGSEIGTAVAKQFQI